MLDIRRWNGQHLDKGCPVPVFVSAGGQVQVICTKCMVLQSVDSIAAGHPIACCELFDNAKQLTLLGSERVM